MATFTPTQGHYLAYIHAYTNLHGYPPAESEMAAALCVSPPSINQMVKTLEKKGLISRQPGQPRSVQILIPDEEIPSWANRRQATSPLRSRAVRLVAKSQGNPLRGLAKAVAAPPASLYVLSVYMVGGPIGAKFANKEISRVIEIRGDQTLEHLHQAIFHAYDRWEEHQYEFQLGKRPFDPAGPNYGAGSPGRGKKQTRDARTTTLDDLALKPGRGFGYRFDFGDDWYHQVGVDRIESAIPTVTYPRIIKRVGKSPPQYLDR